MVGLGRVSWSLKTTPRAPLSLRSGLSGRVERIEVCEMPVEGARSISAEADGVAVWRMGRLISGLLPPSTGSVDDFDILDMFPAAVASDVGSVLVFVMLPCACAGLPKLFSLTGDPVSVSRLSPSSLVGDVGVGLLSSTGEAGFLAGMGGGMAAAFARS